MRYLLLASLLWAFSFGLIKGRLAGLDPATVAAGRLFLAAVAFSFLMGGPRPRGRMLPAALALGGLQFGLMYWLYIASFAHLQAWQVAFLTVFTPIYVVLLADLGHRRWAWRNLLAGLLAVAGSILAGTRAGGGSFAWQGVLLLQGANLVFAAGQLLYPRLKRATGLQDAPLLGWMYWGAFLVAGLGAMVGGGPVFQGWNGPALATLLYLGLLPTALGFYLWNRGAARVRPGPLAAANNLKIPLAVVVSWLVFGEQAPWLRALLGLTVVVAGLFLAEAGRSKSGPVSGGMADRRG